MTVTQSGSVVWAATLTSGLLAAEQRRMSKRLADLCRRQQQLTQSPHLGFLYDGVWFTLKGAASPAQKDRKGLHMELWAEMGKFMWERNELRRDHDTINQTLRKLLLGYEDLQDIRDAVPDVVIAFNDDLKRLPRQKTAGYTIRTDHRAWRQYEKALSLMEMYAATHLLY